MDVALGDSRLSLLSTLRIRSLPCSLMYVVSLGRRMSARGGGGEQWGMCELGKLPLLTHARG